ncbi:hypothetical protein KTT_58040 [Tengunoibacter tsumagoiensis]|uniref:Uncharacterized protein n=1 Tax=Tengunoibacter tsumagoiensis TaxID=2014871 RepID=A0A402AAG7_9CHLR|nr:hypothetical protein KTT_58040 [Tengunoibacter tsumagoiensis]
MIDPALMRRRGCTASPLHKILLDLQNPGMGQTRKDQGMFDPENVGAALYTQ